ncbi:MAG: MFS transporter [Deltaproteobacteria bacterium]|nr:MAG: MFS transporter [Deltaproteobacteria bacterium]
MAATLRARAAGVCARRLPSITALLFAVPLIEELASGVQSSGAPDIERSFGLSHTATAVVLFLVPGLVQLVLDPVWFWLAERFGRPWLVRGGLAIMAAAQLVAAVAPGPVTLTSALSVWGLAAGAANSLSELTLIDHRPDERARTLARWTLLSLLGYVGAPVVLGGLALIAPQAAWRVGFAIAGAMLAVWAVAVSLRAFPAAAVAAVDDEPPLWQAAREALRDRVLIGWLFGTALCSLLDEILIVFASLHVRDELGATATGQNAVVVAFIAGGAIGLVGLERLLARYGEHRLMIAAGLACGAAFAAWLAAPALWLSVVLMVPVGATAAPLYPLATAQAYARCPGRSSVVLVASHLFAPLVLALPWLLGWVADRAGTLCALALLAVQPIGLVVLALTTGDRDSRDSRTGDPP